MVPRFSRSHTFFFLFVFLLHVVLSTTEIIELDYGLMIDAGSTGTRIHIYEWPVRHRDTIPLVEQAPIDQVAWTKEVKPGLATFANNLTAIPAYLQPLITFAQEKIDPSKYADTPLYLKATAGMRALPADDQRNIMEVVRKLFSGTPFLFQNDYAKIIPGFEEAIFGWITVNHLFGRLTTSNTYGSLDLGGASTQITFIPRNHIKIPEEFRYVLTLGEQSYTLYAQSFMNYGVDAARRVVDESLLASANGNSKVDDPCLLDGDISPFSSKGDDVLLVGTSDFDGCQSDVDALFSKSECRYGSPANCSFNGVYQPPINGVDFVAFSGYYYFTNFFGESGELTVGNVGELAANYCGLTLDEALKAFKNSSYVRSECFAGTYAYQLLNYGYGFPTEKEVTFLGSVAGVDLGWALGAMIFEANLLPIDSDSLGTMSLEML